MAVSGCQARCASSVPLGDPKPSFLGFGKLLGSRLHQCVPIGVDPVGLTVESQTALDLEKDESPACSTLSVRGGPGMLGVASTGCFRSDPLLASSVYTPVWGGLRPGIGTIRREAAAGFLDTGDIKGVGTLIGKDLVLTAAHVAFQPALKPGDAAKLQGRFSFVLGYEADRWGTPPNVEDIVEFEIDPTFLLTSWIKSDGTSIVKPENDAQVPDYAVLRILPKRTIAGDVEKEEFPNDLGFALTPTELLPLLTSGFAPNGGEKSTVKPNMGDRLIAYAYGAANEYFPRSLFVHHGGIVVRDNSDSAKYSSYFDHNFSTHAGQSGAPIFNERGQLLGVHRGSLRLEECFNDVWRGQYIKENYLQPRRVCDKDGNVLSAEKNVKLSRSRYDLPNNATSIVAIFDDLVHKLTNSGGIDAFQNSVYLENTSAQKPSFLIPLPEPVSSPRLDQNGVSTGFPEQSTQERAVEPVAFLSGIATAGIEFASFLQDQIAGSDGGRAHSDICRKENPTNWSSEAISHRVWLMHDLFERRPSLLDASDSAKLFNRHPPAVGKIYLSGQTLSGVETASFAGSGVLTDRGSVISTRHSFPYPLASSKIYFSLDHKIKGTQKIALDPRGLRGSVRGLLDFVELWPVSSINDSTPWPPPDADRGFYDLLYFETKCAANPSACEGDFSPVSPVLKKAPDKDDKLYIVGYTDAANWPKVKKNVDFSPLVVEVEATRAHTFINDLSVVIGNLGQADAELDEKSVDLPQLVAEASVIRSHTFTKDAGNTSLVDHDALVIKGFSGGAVFDGAMRWVGLHHRSLYDIICPFESSLHAYTDQYYPGAYKLPRQAGLFSDYLRYRGRVEKYAGTDLVESSFGYRWNVTSSKY